MSAINDSKKDDQKKRQSYNIFSSNDNTGLLKSAIDLQIELTAKKRHSYNLLQKRESIPARLDIPVISPESQHNRNSIGLEYASLLSLEKIKKNRRISTLRINQSPSINLEIESNQHLNKTRASFLGQKAPDRNSILGQKTSNRSSRFSMNSGSNSSNLNSLEISDDGVRPSIRSYRRSMAMVSAENKSNTNICSSPDALNQMITNNSNSQLADSAKKKKFVSNSVIAETLKEQGNVFLNALQTLENRTENNPAIGDSPSSPAPPPPPPIYSSVNQSKIDYSLIFPPNINRIEGLSKFRMEALKPVLVPETDHGQFCVADAYIIMYSTLKNFNFEYSIHTWIGPEAETDKRFCCAMYSVALRNQLQSNIPVQRQSHESETDEFKAYFTYIDQQTQEQASSFTILDASYATPTGLQMACGKSFPTKLYRWDQKNKIPLFLVELSINSLDSRYVYLLDAGMEIYQWNGALSSLQNRSKARMIAQRVNKSERVGKAEYFEIEEVEATKSETFIEILNELENGQAQEEEDGIDLDSFNLDLYRVAPQTENSDSLQGNLLKSGKFKKAMLDPDHCFVLDAGTEVSVWIGRTSSQDETANSTRLLVDILESKKRPSWISVNRYVQGAEPETFKLQFSDWQEASAPPKLVKTIEKTEVELNIGVPFSLYPQEYPFCENNMELANSYLEGFTSFVFSRGKFVTLPPRESRNFFEKDAYAFLCVYQAAEKQLTALLDHPVTSFESPDLILLACNRTENDSETYDEVVTRCVVYFCQTPAAGKVPYSNFQLATLKEMQDLIRVTYKCPLVVKLVDYGQEPYALLAHLENSYILHAGSRQDYYSKKGKSNKVYQIITDIRYQTSRTIEIVSEKVLLCPRDCFFFKMAEGQQNMLWRGADYDTTALNCAIDPVQKILDLYSENEENIHGSIQELDENEPESEVPEVLLPKNVSLIENSLTINDTTYPLVEISSQPAKMLICSSSSGFFQVERCAFYIQKNLIPESCVLLDPGSDYPLYVWISTNCSKLVKELSRKCAMQWLDCCQDGRKFIATNGDDTEYNIQYIEQGAETEQFKAYFFRWDKTDVVDPGNLFLRTTGKQGWKLGLSENQRRTNHI